MEGGGLFRLHSFPSLPPCKIAFQPPTFISRLLDSEYAQLSEGESHYFKTLQFCLRWYTPDFPAFISATGVVINVAVG